SYLKEKKKNRALLQIEHALDVYKIRNGRYPAALNELVAAKFLHAPEHAENISYIPEEDSYRLSITTAGNKQ
ncbi:MAG: type II secretion system protein GspG, partial [Proteobacteria bacterium]|nr:type II secretion system protein GspG [Pseudomonadota bacterium]